MKIYYKRYRVGGLEINEIFLIKEPIVYYNVQGVLVEFKEKRDDFVAIRDQERLHGGGGN